MANHSEYGVRASLLSSRAWPGVSRCVFDVRWDTEPGWMTWSFDQPLLCLLRGEIGGRGELRVRADTPAEGEYFGTGHLSVVAASEPITLYSASLRQARFACFLLNPEQADCLTAGQAESIRRAPSRIMFQDERLRSCAELLSDYESDGERDPYALALTRALFAALLGVMNPHKMPSEAKLTGAPLARVLTYIIDHLDQSMTNETLARVAEISPTQLSRAFREATGLSPQRWQMDARVRRAQRLMVDDPAESLASIARRAGFSDQSHFSRAFLDIIGVMPSAWLHQRR